MRASLAISVLTLGATLFAQGGTARAEDVESTISRIAVRTPTGEYWSAGASEDGQLRIFADSPRLGATEVFWVDPAEHERWQPACMPNGARVELTTTAGHVWSVEDRQLLLGDPSTGASDPKAVFTLINETDGGRCFRYGDRISIISAEDYYLSASPQGMVDADQKHRGGWEIFDLVDPANPPPSESAKP